MFEVGLRTTLAKVASLDGTVHEVVDTVLKAHLPAGKEPGPGDELEDLLPEDGDLEAVVFTLEENFDVVLPTDDVFALFAEGTVADLEQALVKRLATKTASYSHSYYMRNRARERQRSRQYRMRNLHQVRRKSRIYRAQVSRGARRPRQRVGSAGGGYMYIQR